MTELCQLEGRAFGHIFWDIDFKFVLLIIYIKIEAQTNLEVNRNSLGHLSQ